MLGPGDGGRAARRFQAPLELTITFPPPPALGRCGECGDPSALRGIPRLPSAPPPSMTWICNSHSGSFLRPQTQWWEPVVGRRTRDTDTPTSSNPPVRTQRTRLRREEVGGTAAEEAGVSPGGNGRCAGAERGHGGTSRAQQFRLPSAQGPGTSLLFAASRRLLSGCSGRSWTTRRGGGAGNARGRYK